MIRLVEFQPSKEELSSRCQLKGSCNGIEVWLIDCDQSYFYLRQLEDEVDNWFQVPSEKIFNFLESGLEPELRAKLSRMVQEGKINVVNSEIRPIKQQYFTFGDDIEVLIENKINLDFIRPAKDTLIERIKSILFEIEREYSEYEVQYWKCNWTSPERRFTWRERVENADLEDL